MNKINYDENKNEVTITGCVDCPFCHYKERESDHSPYCSLDEDILVEEWQEYYDVLVYIPYECPLRDPNFKLTRILE